jgi:hypothetical protein
MLYLLTALRLLLKTKVQPPFVFYNSSFENNVFHIKHPVEQITKALSLFV